MVSIGNNELCHCGSTKKYKKCCKNKVHQYAPPKNIFQKLARDFNAERLQDVKEAHCMVCGDKKDLLEIRMDIGEMCFCRFCYKIQIDMSKQSKE